MWADDPAPYRPPRPSAWRSPWPLAAVLFAGISIGSQWPLIGPWLGLAVPGTAALPAPAPSPSGAALQGPSRQLQARPEAGREASAGAHPRPSSSPRLVIPSEAPPPVSRPIYLCRDYGGNLFWSSALCSTQRATIERIVTVPGGASWEHAMAIGEHERQEAAALRAPPAVALTAGGIGPGGVSASPECAALVRYVEQLDAAARQPLGAAQQDHLRSERRHARDRQSALRC